MTPHFMRYVIEYACFRALQSILLLMPRWMVLRSGAAAGWVIGRVLRFRWQVAIDNLRRAFPDRPVSVISEMAGKSFASVGATLFELAWMQRLSGEQLQAIVRVENPETLVAAHARGTGVIVLTAHYGSWEILGQLPLFILGKAGALLVKGLANPLIDRRVDMIRRQFGNLTVPATIAVRDLLHTLRAGGWILMAADQSAPRESVLVTFFGRDVPTYQGAAILALKTGAHLVLGLARRAEDGTYDVRFEHVPADDLQGTSPDAVRTLTARHVRATEQAMMDEPHQWMWMHRRWKHLDARAEDGCS